MFDKQKKRRNVTAFWAENVRKFFEYFEIEQHEEEVETVGGLVQKSLCRLAKVKDEIEIENLKIKVVEMKGRRIQKLLVEKFEKNETSDQPE